MARPSMGMNDPGDGPPRTTVSTDSVMNAKFNRPPTRDDWVDRARLVGQLDEAIQLPVTLVSAPAGYGKTTLISQWLAATRNPRAAWVSLDPGDNDPGRLWRHLAVALERVGCKVPADVGDITDAATGEIMTGVLPRMLSALSAMPDDIVILLDDFHVLRDTAVRDQVEVLTRNLPPQAHLVICTRADPGLRLGRLRASGRLAEIRAADLNFTLDEAATLLSRVDVVLSDESLVRLVDRTEGWPAGLYLATLSLAGRNDPEEFVRQFSGGNRFVVDYLTEEVLARHSDEIREFIVSMSVLDRFSAPLCDFVRGSTGSAAILAHLERSNLFLVPLDDERHWYRFHHLFAAVARIELEFEGPERVQALHSRALEWFRDHGHVDEAVKHALAAGRPTDAAVLVRENWLSYVDTDRAATVVGWLEAIGSRSVADDPAAGVTAAWMAALCGQEEKLNKLLTELEEFRDVGPLPDGARSVESAIAMIRGHVRLWRTGRHGGRGTTCRRARDRQQLAVLCALPGGPGALCLRPGRPGARVGRAREVVLQRRRPGIGPRAQPCRRVARRRRAVGSLIAVVTTRSSRWSSSWTAGWATCPRYRWHGPLSGRPRRQPEAR